ncbi:MAG: hypothetical protein NTV81_00780 [Candidatus Komeilibacteria bacterium]|nr:hypothetical protein [Candidatus Komeilibacteria bacterium]
MSDNILAEQLIGSAPSNRLPRTGNHVPQPDALDQPLSDEAEGRVFCAGCGTLLEFGPGFIVAVQPGLEGEFFPDTHYLRAGSCPTCDEANQFTGISSAIIPL